MFFPIPAPPHPPPQLHALRLSLNTPVVALDQLPVGPASAAIALAERPGGGLRVTIALRAVRGGQLAFYAPDDEEDLPDPGLALDAALSFAESMGFLFDDDEVETRGAAGPREAAGIWRQFLAMADDEHDALAQPADDELLLEDLVYPDPDPDPELETGPELDAEPEIVPPPPRAAAPEPPPELEMVPEPDLRPEPEPEPDPVLLLTKFRRAAALRPEPADSRVRLMSRF